MWKNGMEFLHARVRRQAISESVCVCVCVCVKPLKYVCRCKIINSEIEKIVTHCGSSLTSHDTLQVGHAQVVCMNEQQSMDAFWDGVSLKKRQTADIMHINLDAFRNAVKKQQSYWTIKTKLYDSD